MRSLISRVIGISWHRQLLCRRHTLCRQCPDREALLS